MKKRVEDYETRHHDHRSTFLLQVVEGHWLKLGLDGQIKINLNQTV